MRCEACQSAEKLPYTSGLYDMACDGCKARHIAHGRELFEQTRVSYTTQEYKDLLTRVFGPDRLNEAHQMVKQWAKKIEGNKNGALMQISEHCKPMIFTIKRG